MALAVRTIYRLDESREERRVHGFLIAPAVPVPNNRARPSVLVDVLLALQVGESFEHTNPCKEARHQAMQRADGLHFNSRKIGPGKWRIWRTATRSGK